MADKMHGQPKKRINSFNKKEKTSNKNSLKSAPKKIESKNTIKKKIKPGNEGTTVRKKNINDIKKNETDSLEKIDKESIDSDALERGDKPMTIVEHLDEFRSRLIICLIIIVILAAISFFISDHLLNYINEPFLKSKKNLNIFKLIDGFLIRFKVSAMVGIFLGIPIIIYQIWKFIVPAISIPYRKLSRYTIISSVLLFYGGMAFVFYILIPAMITVLLRLISNNMVSMIGADNYIKFVLMSCLSMGIIFELPIIILILTRIGLLTPQFLIKNRKYSIILILITATIVTQDLLLQIIVAIPLIILYEISIIISKYILMRNKKRVILD